MSFFSFNFLCARERERETSRRSKRFKGCRYGIFDGHNLKFYGPLFNVTLGRRNFVHAIASRDHSKCRVNIITSRFLILCIRVPSMMKYSLILFKRIENNRLKRISRFQMNYYMILCMKDDTFA